MKSFAGAVTTTGDNGEFSKNGLRFATHKEAEAYLDNLRCRWYAVVDVRVEETEDEPNSVWNFDMGTLDPIKKSMDETPNA